MDESTVPSYDELPVKADAPPQDAAIASYLRKSGRPVFLVVNKADHPGADVLVSQLTEMVLIGHIGMHAEGLKAAAS